MSDVCYWGVVGRASLGSWYGPLGVVAAARLGVPPPIAAIIGPVGLSGSAATFAVVTTQTTVPGLAVTVSRSTGQASLATNNYKPNAFVAGLAVEAISPGFVVDIQTGPFTLADWTAVIGAVSLQPGTPYFLGVNGLLTATPPSNPNCLVLIGVASTSKTLNVAPQSPVQL